LQKLATLFLIISSRLEHHRPTSHEVGMQTALAETLFCRLEHHGPTSHEVGMREKMTRAPFNIPDDLEVH
jgi:hypothetical protein